MAAAKTLIVFCEVSKVKDVDFVAFAKAHNLFNTLRSVRAKRSLWVFFASHPLSKQAMYNDECNETQESAVLGVGVIGSTRAGLQLLEVAPVEAKVPISKRVSEFSRILPLWCSRVDILAEKVACSGKQPPLLPCGYV